MKLIACCFAVVFLFSCKHYQLLPQTSRSSARTTGSAFYQTAAAFGWQQRDYFAVAEILSGNIPYFLNRFVPVPTSVIDSTGRKIEATFYVTPDYISIGTDADWARISLTPMAAQRIATQLQCFLPTRKMVDLIYNAAEVKLAPVPLLAFRDSTPTMYHHHLIIEGQRQGRTGLVAGHKKDVVISSKVTRDPKPNRVAIYGWHQLNGKPIQPLYTGHIRWYVDYSHGIRLVYRKIWVEGKLMNYTDVLAHPVYRRLLCDEEVCDFYRYATE